MCCSICWPCFWSHYVWCWGRAKVKEKQLDFICFHINLDNSCYDLLSINTFLWDPLSVASIGCQVRVYLSSQLILCVLVIEIWFCWRQWFRSCGNKTLRWKSSESYSHFVIKSTDISYKTWVHLWTFLSPCRLGFLGLLHMEVFNQRLEQEYNASVIMTAPTVPYKAILSSPKLIKVRAICCSYVCPVLQRSLA